MRPSTRSTLVLVFSYCHLEILQIPQPVEMTGKSMVVPTPIELQKTRAPMRVGVEARLILAIEADVSISRYQYDRVFLGKLGKL
jgi:hypothetical protein